MSFTTPMPRRTSGGLIAASLLLILFLFGWTIFGYVVIIKAIIALSGGLETALTVYLVGNIIILILTMVIKAALRR